MGDLDRRDGAPVQGFGRIPWEMHYRAWLIYHKSHPRQSVTRIAERGGFGVQEMDEFVPGWRDELREAEQLRNRVAELEADIIKITGGDSLWLTQVIQEAHREGADLMLQQLERRGGYETMQPKEKREAYIETALGEVRRD